MTLNKKEYNNYEEIKVDYIQIAQNLQINIIELDSVIEQILSNDALSDQEVYNLLNDHLNKIKNAYTDFESIANDSLDMIDAELEILEDFALSECYDKLLYFNEEKDQINKEIDCLTEYFDNAKSLVEKYTKQYDNNQDVELGQE